MIVVSELLTLERFIKREFQTHSHTQLQFFILKSMLFKATSSQTKIVEDKIERR